MTTDLTGGLSPTREHVIPQRPDDPEMRDSVSFWTVDDGGRIGLPRIGIEAVGANWDNHEIQINIAFPDGRVYRLRGAGPSLSPLGPEGEPTVLGAGGLVFRCLAPFDTWTMTYDGQATQTSSADLVAGRPPGPLVDVSIIVEANMVVPPWIQGALHKDASERIANSVEGQLMGGPRYEQLFRATGSVTIAGETQQFSGTGLRIRRQVCADSRSSGATRGNPPCFPVGERSVTSPTRPGRTGNPPSTRVISSPAMAI